MRFLSQSVLFAMFICAVLVIVSFLVLEERERVLEDTSKNLTNITQAIGERYASLNGRAIAIRNALQPLFTRAEITKSPIKPLIEDRLLSISTQDPHLIEIVIFSLNGSILASSSGSRRTESVSPQIASSVFEQPTYHPISVSNFGLATGRAIQPITVALKGLDNQISAGLGFIYDTEKQKSFLSEVRVYEQVHVSVTNVEGEILIHAEAGDEAGHEITGNLIRSKTTVLTPPLGVEAHISTDAALEANWTQLAVLSLSSTIILLSLASLGWWRLRVSDLRRSNALLLADRRLRRINTIFDATPDAILSVNADSIIQSANNSAERLFGYPQSELVGMPIEALIPEKHHKVHRNHVERFLAAPKQHKTTMGDWRKVQCVRADGSNIPILASLGTISDPSSSETVVLIRDMSDAKVADDNMRQLSFELARELEAAKEADRAKSAFLAQMSHELRTPLNAIIGFAEAGKLEQFGKISPSVYREYAEDIHSSGLHLLSLVNDILDFSKIDANKQDLNIDEIEIKPLVSETLKIAGQLAAEAGVRIRCRGMRSVNSVFADYRALHQCLLNLLSNAIRHSENGSLVVLELARVGSTIEFRIVDQGAGISAENLTRIGKPFEQFEDPMTSKRKGTGLGLAITRSLMELMAGQLLIESQLGHGTVAKLVFYGADPSS